MRRTKQEKNKALVLEAFDTLFDKRDYVAANAIGPLTTFNIALISRPVVRGANAAEQIVLVRQKLDQGAMACSAYRGHFRETV